MYFNGALGLIASAAFAEEITFGCNSSDAYLLGCGCLVPAHIYYWLWGLPCTTRSSPSEHCTELCFELMENVCSSMAILLCHLHDLGLKGRMAQTSERTCCCLATGFQSLSGPRE